MSDDQKRTRAEASRRNGQKSRGPKTSEGKTRSSANAVKHGALAKVHRPEHEAVERYERLEAGLIRRLAPNGPGELQLVQSMANDLVRLNRLEDAERAACALAKMEIGTTDAATNERASTRAMTRVACRVLLDEAAAIAKVAALNDGLNYDVVKRVRALSSMAMELAASQAIDHSVDGADRLAQLVAVLPMLSSTTAESSFEVVQEFAMELRKHVDRLDVRDAERDETRRSLEETLADVPDERVVKRFDRYRSATERSMLRRIEILKGLRDLGMLEEPPK